MPLSWNEIKSRAIAFSRDWSGDAAYGRKGFKTDAERVAFLFDIYQRYTSLLPPASAPKRSRKCARA